MCTFYLTQVSNMRQYAFSHMGKLSSYIGVNKSDCSVSMIKECKPTSNETGISVGSVYLRFLMILSLTTSLTISSRSVPAKLRSLRVSKHLCPKSLKLIIVNFAKISSMISINSAWLSIKSCVFYINDSILS